MRFSPFGRSCMPQAIGASLCVTNGFMPTARHGNWWWCSTFRQCRSMTPCIREAAIAALLSSPIGQHVYQARKQKCETSTRLQVAMGHRGKPWAGCSYSLWGVAVLVLLLLYISRSWTCSESLRSRDANWSERQVSAFGVDLVNLAQSDEHLSWKPTLLGGCSIQKGR